MAAPTETEATAQQTLGGIGGSLVTRWLRLFDFSTRRATAIEASPSKRTYLTVLAAVTLALLVALRAIDSVLAELHLYAGERFTTANLGKLFHPFGGGHLKEVLSVWSDAAKTSGADLDQILRSYGVLDVFFVISYTLLGAAALVALANAFRTMSKDPGSIAQQRLLRRGVASTGERLVGETERVSALLGGYETLAQQALALLYALAALDIVENVLIIALPWIGAAGWIAIAFSILASAKLVFGVAVVLASLLASAAYLLMRPGRTAYLLNALLVVRGQVLVVLVLYAGLFFSDQSVDALRRWREDRWDFAFALTVLLWLSLLVVATSRELLRFSSHKRPWAELPIRLLALGVLLGIASFFTGLFLGAPLGLLALAIVLVVVAILSWPLGDISDDDRRRGSASARRWLPITLGLAVLALPAYATLRAYVGPAVLDQGGVGAGAVYVALLTAAAVLLDRFDHQASYVWIKHRWAALSMNFALLAYLIWRIWDNPWRISEAFGAVGLLSLFLVAATFPLYYLVRRAERVRPPAMFSLMRLRRTPIITLLAVWLILGGRLDSQSSYNDVRVVGRDAANEDLLLPRQGVSVEAAFVNWKSRQPATGRPMLLVAAAGGGIRAAYWTARVLSCVLEGVGPDPACQAGDNPAGEPPDLRATALAASGISGGSLGLTAYVAHVRTGDDDPEWPRKRLDDDYIAPTIGWALFVDFPSALLRRTGGSDRDEILERALERSWIDPSDHDYTGVLWEGAVSTETSPLAEGLFQSRDTPKATPTPLLLLNGTKVQDGCRLMGSVLDASVDYAATQRTAENRLSESCLSLGAFTAATTVPGDKPLAESWALATTDDLTDYLCEGEDVRLSTAVMLSARFPYVVPSGRLTPCSKEGAIATTNVVDGGYFDTSAASPLVELWARLEPLIRADLGRGECTVPYFLQIDTGYADPAPARDKRPSELQVFPQTLRRARDAREHNARQAAALQFSLRFPEGGRADRYYHVFPHVHPGVRAPLGWTLSRSSQAELDDQLRLNAEEIESLRRALSEPQQCAREAG